MTEKLLKLRAKDGEDVQVVSAVLQDAIAPVCDMLYNAAEKNFVMVVHRLRRESGAEAPDRICCAVNIKGAVQAKLQNIDLARQGRILDLLAAILEGDALTFVFAGNAKIRLTLGDWSMIVEDFGEAWPSQCHPCHDSAASGAA